MFLSSQSSFESSSPAPPQHYPAARLPLSSSTKINGRECAPVQNQPQVHTSLYWWQQYGIGLKKQSASANSFPNSGGWSQLWFGLHVCSWFGLSFDSNISCNTETARIYLDKSIHCKCWPYICFCGLKLLPRLTLNLEEEKYGVSKKKKSKFSQILQRTKVLVYVKCCRGWF